MGILVSEEVEELKECPVCGSRKIAVTQSVKDFALTQEEFTVWQCADCRLEFTNPRPAAGEIGRYYDFPDYVSHTDESGGWLNQAYRVARMYTVGRKVGLIDQLVKGKTVPKTLLDYGCGSGYFVAAAAKDGWQVMGLEPNEKARSQASELVGSKGKVVESLDELLATKSKFSIITLWHVLEHVHQLNETVGVLMQLLDKGGRLVVAVPNAEAEDAKHYGQHWAAYDVPRHLYHFNPNAMKDLWARHGAEVLTTKPMPLDTYYVSLLSERFRKGSAVSALLQAWKANGRASKNGKYSSLLYTLKRVGDA